MPNDAASTVAHPPTKNTRFLFKPVWDIVHATTAYSIAKVGVFPKRGDEMYRRTPFGAAPKMAERDFAERGSETSSSQFQANYFVVSRLSFEANSNKRMASNREVAVSSVT